MGWSIGHFDPFLPKIWGLEQWFWRRTPLSENLNNFQFLPIKMIIVWSCWLKLHHFFVKTCNRRWVQLLSAIWANKGGGPTNATFDPSEKLLNLFTWFFFVVAVFWSVVIVQHNFLPNPFCIKGKRDKKAKHIIKTKYFLIKLFHFIFKWIDIFTTKKGKGTKGNKRWDTSS